MLQILGTATLPLFIHDGNQTAEKSQFQIENFTERKFWCRKKNPDFLFPGGIIFYEQIDSHRLDGHQGPVN